MLLQMYAGANNWIIANMNKDMIQKFYKFFRSPTARSRTITLLRLRSSQKPTNASLISPSE